MNWKKSHTVWARESNSKIFGKKVFQDPVNVQFLLSLDESINTINEKGRYFVSKFKNSKVPTMSMLQRKDMNVTINPGPGRYEPHDSTSPDGKYSNSKHVNSLTRHFPKENRASIVPKLKTPGPGFYRLPS